MSEENIYKIVIEVDQNERVVRVNLDVFPEEIRTWALLGMFAECASRSEQGFEGFVEMINNQIMASRRKK